MRYWELLDQGLIPGTTSVMLLMRRGHELMIQVDNRPLMSNVEHGSEDALADLACDRIGKRKDARVLIGGLGMGFTLAAALRRLGPEGRVMVAEVVPAILQWNRGLLGPVAGHPLKDPRVVVHEGDVADPIRDSNDSWDAILLDVDNGPDALTRPENNWLYGRTGLLTAWESLRPGGVLAVWSAARDPTFTPRLQRVGFDVEEIGVRSRGKAGGRRHVVWVATRS